MKNINILVTLLLSAFLLVSCGKDDSVSGTSGQAAAPAEVAEATQDDLPWSSLNETQKIVLSVGEIVWSSIPLERRREMAAVADRWTQTGAEEQYKILNELRGYAGAPPVGPSAKAKK